MDFGFAPGVTPKDQRVHTPHGCRAPTPAFPGMRRLTLKRFVDHLPASTTATRSIDTEWLGVNASGNGCTFVPGSAWPGADSNLNTVDEAQATASSPSITADPVFDPAPDDLWFEKLGCTSLADLSVGGKGAHGAKDQGSHP